MQYRYYHLLTLWVCFVQNPKKKKKRNSHDMYGRLPLIFKISCWLILLARNIYSLYAARLIVGLAIGNAGILVPVFIAEISSDRSAKY